MEIIKGWRSDPERPLTDPLPERKWSVVIRFLGGDVCHPVGAGNWFKPPYFTRVWRWFCHWPVLPFIAWRFNTKGGYIGAKVYGVDSPAYAEWPCMKRSDVYAGSQALMFSVRPFASINEEG